MAAIYSNGGNRWNILGFNFTERDALSSVYIRYICWLRHRGITFLTNIECVGIAPGPLAGIKPAHSGAALQKALVAFSATAPD
jgi:hypothetical protein